MNRLIMSTCYLLPATCLLVLILGLVVLWCGEKGQMVSRYDHEQLREQAKAKKSTLTCLYSKL